MRKLALVCCCTLFTFLVFNVTTIAGGMDPEIKEGDDRALVIEILGQPDGAIGGGGLEAFYYKRGKVVLEGGKVKTADLISESEAAKREAIRIMEDQERRRAAAKARDQRIREGNAELKTTLADREFAGAPPIEQVAYWRSFRKKYPEVNVNKHLAAAHTKLNAERKAGEAGLTKEQEAELDRRIAEGVNDPPVKMSKRSLRRYRRGHSSSMKERREQQITEEYLAELAAGPGR